VKKRSVVLKVFLLLTIPPDSLLMISPKVTYFPFSSFPCLRAVALQRAGVEAGIQGIYIVSCFRRAAFGLLLEFIPMQIGAGVTAFRA